MYKGFMLEDKIPPPPSNPLHWPQKPFHVCNPSFTDGQSSLIQPRSVLYYIAYCPLSTLVNGFQVEWFMMCRQTDRQAPCISQKQSPQPHKRHARTDTDTPIITSLQHNSTQRRFPKLHLGLHHYLCLCSSLSLWQEVGTAPIMPGMQQPWWQSALRRLEGSRWGLPVLEVDWLLGIVAERGLQAYQWG